MSSFKPLLKKLKLSRKQCFRACVTLGGLLVVTPFVLWVGAGGVSWFTPGGVGLKQDTEISETKKILRDGNEITVTTKYVSGKTIWDWLSVLGVPLSLTVIGTVLGYRLQNLSTKQAVEQAKIEKEREAKQAEIEKERASIEKEIADSNQKEEVLQAYFDRLSALLIDKNLIAIAAKNEVPDHRLKEDQELLNASRDIIRARTLSILRRLEGDGKRKGSVIQFLAEAKVISKLKLDLSGANLSGARFHRADLQFAKLCRAQLVGADLFDADLRFADLHRANLIDSNLCRANLIGTDLSFADLSDADLSFVYLNFADPNNADLIRADFSFADLSRAQLVAADLIGAQLCGAVLSGTNLRNADISSAIGLTEEQIFPARLCKTKLPLDIQLNPDRDCEELEKESQ
jgi:uncharacterized protein YjbI with pentapeptide repeats